MEKEPNSLDEVVFAHSSPSAPSYLSQLKIWNGTFSDDPLWKVMGRPLPFTCSPVVSPSFEVLFPIYVLTLYRRYSSSCPMECKQLGSVSRMILYVSHCLNFPRLASHMLVDDLHYRVQLQRFPNCSSPHYHCPSTPLMYLICTRRD